ncbi:MAG: tetratricopeptide repeat protein, partial [Acidobacteriota bacterium]
DVFPGSHLLKGEVLKNQGQTEAALAEYRKELEISDDPKLKRTATVGVAVTCRELGQDDCAEDALQSLIEADPSDATAHAQLIDTYTRLGKIEEAQRALEQAPAEIRNDPIVHFNLGATAWQQGETDTAARAFARTVELDPKMVEAQRLLGYCKIGQGAFAEAIQALEKYLEFAPGAADAAEIEALLESLKEQAAGQN